MTTNELTSLIRQSFEGNTFYLDLANIPNLASMALDYFPDSILQLATAQIDEPNTSETYITVIGIGQNYPFVGLHVSILFYISETDMAFTMSANTQLGNQPWTLGDAFPAFKDSIYTFFPFTTASQLSLYSESHLKDDISLPAGLYIDGNISITQASGGLSMLIGANEQPVFGKMELGNGSGLIKDFEIAGITTCQVDIGVATLDSLEILFAYDTVAYSDDAYDTAIPFIQFTSEFVFANQPIPIFVKAYNTHRIRFEADIEVENLIQVGLDYLSTLIGNQNLQNYLPTNLVLDAFIQLVDIYMEYDANTNSITSIGIEVKNRTPISITPFNPNQTILLDDITLNPVINNPLSDNPSVSMLGGLSIGIGLISKIHLSFIFPEFSFTGALDEESSLSLTELMTALVGSDAGLPEIMVDGLTISISKKTDSFQFDYECQVSIEGDWEIIPDSLFVENLNMYINSDTKEFSIYGLLSICNSAIYLSSEYTGESGEWVFTGGTDDNYVPVKVGYLIQQLAYFFNTNADLPAFLTNLDIRNIGVTFNTLTKDFTFHCEINDTFDDMNVNMKVDVAITLQNDGSYRKTFGGQLFLDSGAKDINDEEIVLAFDLVFSTNKDEFVLLAQYNNINQNPILIQRLVQSLVGIQEWTYAIPQTLTFTIENALFAWYNPSASSEAGNKGKVLFSIDMESGINLSNLPLVGKEFGPEQTAELNYQVVISSDNFSHEELMSFNDLLPYDAAKFITSDISSRFFLNTTLQIAGYQQTLPIPVTINTDGQLQNTPGTALPTQPLWFNIQKALGPVYFSRIGVLYDNELLTFYLDASLQAGALSMAIDGLYVSNPINTIDPTFGIKGLAVDYETGGLAINAALLHQMTNGFDAYNGTATLKMESFGLSALGSYATDGTHYSLFIYGVLNAPLGGEPFFFVTGLAAGLGYNRDLVIPPLAQLGTFPLVMEAMNESYTAQSLEDELNSLAVYIPPSVGMYWGAAGIKFTSFKIIDAFALLTLSLGERFELNIMGMATAVAPPMAMDNLVLAEIQMAMLATFRPSEGMIGVAAQLTDNSFILSRAAKLTGGFALYAWFSGEHAGDFVLSAGGYHPKFIVPKHYPLVPRLGLNWKISTELSVKGQLYYALTAGYMMAGGSLEMTWQSGSIKAWFTIGMDIIVAWKPFHYDLNSYVQVGASYTFDHLGIKKTYSLSAGANLHIWGPEFSGTANIDMKIISFAVSFGAARNLPPTPISWTDFTRSFLPENPITSSITKGLTGQSTNQLGNIIHIVDATSLQFAIQSVMPLTSLNINDGHQFIPITPTTGIAPMNIGIGQVQTTLQLNITKNGVAFHDFTSMAIAKKVPNGLWGETLLPKLNDVLFKENVICGYTFFPQTPVLVPETSFTIQESLFNYQVIHPLAEFSYNEAATITTENTNAENLNVSLAEAIPALITLMQSMELEDTFPNVTDTWADMFLICPKIQTI